MDGEVRPDDCVLTCRREHHSRVRGERLPIAIRAGSTGSNLHMSRRLCARPDNRHPVT
jgi:hypothetical protein